MFVNLLKKTFCDTWWIRFCWRRRFRVKWTERSLKFDLLSRFSGRVSVTECVIKKNSKILARCKIGFFYSIRPTPTQKNVLFTWFRGITPKVPNYIPDNCEFFVHGDIQYSHDVWMFVSYLSITVTNTTFSLTDWFDRFENICICWNNTCVLFIRVILSFSHNEITRHNIFGPRLFLLFRAIGVKSCYKTASLKKKTHNFTGIN